jgi:hypothetical protein
MYFVVDLRRKHYIGPSFKWYKKSDREAWFKFAREVGEKVNKGGVSSISVLGVDPRVVAWTEQFAICNKTQEEGINRGLAEFEKAGVNLRL